ncbi:MAG: YcxB family protein [Tyzzerella sp.]|nr:YcxB family protein [Tyzzerella sp.]
MSVKFTVKMTEKYMYDFMLYHTYTHISGLFGAFLGVVGLIMGINGLLSGDSTSTMLGFIVAAMFLIVTPASTKSRAKMQVTGSPMFQKPLEYELNETGVTVRQDDLEATNEWSEFAKAVSTQKCVILYVTRMRALIFPKECMGDQYEEVLKMIHTHMAPSKVKIRHIH